ncbi:MAG: cyclic nucleotide-binding domain-containing protein [Holophagales bacterium]|nr:cyclic nucleotide-binding domain-containing protein [Holophagales bacterium]
MLDKLFGKKKKPVRPDEGGKELSIEDLITLERYEEALDQLKARVKLAPKDLHSHLKIAEVYVALRDVTRALDSYMYVADTMADDGFFDKGIALLSKAAKLAPGNDAIPKRINRYRTLKRLEHRRSYAIEGLKQNRSTEFSSAANSALEVEMLWNKIARSHLVANLSGEQLQKLFSVMEMTKINEGTVLAQEGQNMPVIFLVVDGVIEAGGEVNGKYFDIRTFSTGDLIGDAALLEQRPWPAQYSVKQSGTVFVLNRQGFEKSMTGHPDPRAFISVLRQQHHDRDIQAHLHKLRAG